MLAEIEVTGAADGEQARAIAARIATSPLVKTALFGHDANWGRVLAAAGSAPYNGGFASVDAARVTLAWNGTTVLERGAPLGVEPDVGNGVCRIALDLGLGAGAASYLTTDLSYDYVRINADYRCMTRVVLKVGGAVAADAAAPCARAPRRSTRCASCTVRARRSRRSWRGAGLDVSSSRDAASRAPTRSGRPALASRR